MAQIEAALVEAPAGRFDPTEIPGLPSPVQRYSSASSENGTRLARSAVIEMRGAIKLGRWIPFRAREILNPHSGSLWRGRAGAVISGFDRYAAGAGEQDWKLAGIFTVMHAEGPDVSKSSPLRGAAEGIWLPAALPPRVGVEWMADDSHIQARFRIGDHPVQLRYRLAPNGLVHSVTFDRWGDPTGSGTFETHRFGCEVRRQRTFAGITIPAEGTVGWHYGTERWEEGTFFRYLITDLRLTGFGPG